MNKPVLLMSIKYVHLLISPNTQLYGHTSYLLLEEAILSNDNFIYFFVLFCFGAITHGYMHMNTSSSFSWLLAIPFNIYLNPHLNFFDLSLVSRALYYNTLRLLHIHTLTIVATPKT